jgi:Protein of unknown function (DUF3572)
MKEGAPLTPEAAKELAIQVLTYIAEEPERLARFLNETGIAATEIRTAASEPGFLTGVLEHMAGNESLLTGFAASAGVDPAAIGKVLQALTGHAWRYDRS